jgi:hypothetical protein
MERSNTELALILQKELDKLKKSDLKVVEVGRNTFERLAKLYISVYGK